MEINFFFQLVIMEVSQNTLRQIRKTSINIISLDFQKN